MTNGLLAPQFGLGRVPLRVPDDTSHPSARDLQEAFASDAPAPVVTFKRRRQLVASPPDSQEGERAPDPVKAPKVYQLAHTAAAEPSRQADEPATEVQVAAPPVHKMRRRRDPARQPTLVQHVVFEPPPVSAPPEVQAPPAVVDKVDAKALRSALAELDAELQNATRCRDAYRDLDKALTSLGLRRPRSSTRR